MNVAYTLFMRWLKLKMCETTQEFSLSVKKWNLFHSWNLGSAMWLALVQGHSKRGTGKRLKSTWTWRGFFPVTLEFLGRHMDKSKPCPHGRDPRWTPADRQPALGQSPANSQAYEGGHPRSCSLLPAFPLSRASGSGVARQAHVLTFQSLCP